MQLTYWGIFLLILHLQIKNFARKIITEYPALNALSLELFPVCPTGPYTTWLRSNCG